MATAKDKEKAPDVVVDTPPVVQDTPPADSDVAQASSPLDDSDRDEQVTPSTAVNSDGTVDRDMNGAARSTGSVSIKPLYGPVEGDHPMTQRLVQQERYEATRSKIINAYKRK